ncbi:MAG: family 10 glycosylhydrolase [Victivallaceae bacterium]|nr:family 10 glycosylhydrolase [Victivallaceae bacterium]
MNKLAAIFTAAMIGCSLFGETLKSANGSPVKYAGRFSARKVDLPDSIRNDFKFRAVWVATVDNIDFGPFKNSDEFSSSFISLVDAMKRENLNVLIFQVRSNNDAWYPSTYNPYSRFLYGKETGDRLPGLNPLEFMVTECHKRNIEFHAWLNPYRVTGGTKDTKKEYLAKLPTKNSARRNSSMVISSPSGKEGKIALTLDPGNPQVRNHIRYTVAEILKYKVDAIHFDDYFYPYEDIGDADKVTFKLYNKSKLSLADWRRENVTALISQISADIKAYNAKNSRNVAFGISPFGIWANQKDNPKGSLTGGKSCYSNLYADVRLWIQKGYIDYVIPQLYWGFAHDVAAYAALCDWWADQVKGTNVKLYTGHAIYNLGANETFPIDEIYNQLRYNSKRPEIGGFSFYSFRRYMTPENNAQKAGTDKVKQAVRTMGKPKAQSRKRGPAPAKFEQIDTRKQAPFRPKGGSPGQKKNR